VTTTFDGVPSSLDASASVRLAATRLRRERGMWRRLTFELRGRRRDGAWPARRSIGHERFAGQVPCRWRSRSSEGLGHSLVRAAASCELQQDHGVAVLLRLVHEPIVPDSISPQSTQIADERLHCVAVRLERCL
jgi:hypothetical protein